MKTPGIAIHTASRLIALCLLFFSSKASAELEPFRFLAHPLDATINTVNLVASDASLPLTKYQSGDWKVAVSPVSFDVDQAFFTTEGEGGGADFRGEDLGGWGGSLVLSYAFTDRWQVFGLVNGVTIDGELLGKEPATASTDQHRVAGDNSYIVFSGGIGYELLESHPKWSSTAFAGLSTQIYNTDMTSLSLDNTQPDTAIEGGGVLFGGTLGIQTSYLAGESFEISPYVFVFASLKNPEVDITVTDTNGNGEFFVGQRISGDIGAGIFPVFGLQLGYKPWGINFNLGGLFTSLYSKELYEGLEVTKISFSYSWGKE